MSISYKIIEKIFSSVFHNRLYLIIILQNENKKLYLSYIFIG
jgi:hypothetical protein